jgi:predicted transposase/invertase (TIGR01784 family)
MKTDTLFYRLFQDRPALLFALAGLPSPPPEAGYALQAEEIKETAFRLDGVLVPVDPERYPPIFLEVQAQPDADFYPRWFAEIYLYLYRRQFKGEWRAVVCYPRREVETAAPPAYRTTLDNPWVYRVYLDEALRASPGTDSALGLLGLILAKPQASADQARTLIAGAGTERPWLLDWIETVLVYKFPKLSREEIRMLLDLQDPELRQTRFFQEVFAEGHEEGLDEGRKEGRRLEALALVLRLLRRRLGPLARETEERLAALSLACLEDLGEALLDFARPADLADWLRRGE